MSRELPVMLNSETSRIAIDETYCMIYSLPPFDKIRNYMKRGNILETETKFNQLDYWN